MKTFMLRIKILLIRADIFIFRVIQVLMSVLSKEVCRKRH